MSQPAQSDEAFLQALYKGSEQLGKNQLESAKASLEEALGMRPGDSKAENLLGLACFKLGEYDRAQEIYQRLVYDNPTDATLRVNLGLVHLKVGRYEDAMREFEAATDLQPGHRRAQNYLGLAYARVGDFAQARECFALAGSDAMVEKMERALAGEPFDQNSLPSPGGPPAAQAAEGAETAAGEQAAEAASDEAASGDGRQAAGAEAAPDAPGAEAAEPPAEAADTGAPADAWDEGEDEADAIYLEVDDPTFDEVPEPAAGPVTQAAPEPPAEDETDFGSVSQEISEPPPSAVRPAGRKGKGKGKGGKAASKAAEADQADAQPAEAAAPDAAAAPAQADAAEKAPDMAARSAAGPQPARSAAPPPEEAVVGANAFHDAPVPEWIGSSPLLDVVAATHCAVFGTGPFLVGEDVIVEKIEGELLTRMRGLVAAQGPLAFAPEVKRFRGRATDKPFGEAEDRMLRVTGEGRLILARQGWVYTPIDLDPVDGYFREGVLQAFSETVAYENGRVPSQVSPDLNLVHLRGKGSVLLRSSGRLLSTDVAAGRSLRVPMARLVGWHGMLTPRILQIADEGGEGGSPLVVVELVGEGVVLTSLPPKR